jgi:hypothetical protein
MDFDQHARFTLNQRNYRHSWHPLTNHTSAETVPDTLPTDHRWTVLHRYPVIPDGQMTVHHVNREGDWDVAVIRPIPNWHWWRRHFQWKLKEHGW